jgi:hypothetical protein
MFFAHISGADLFSEIYQGMVIQGDNLNHMGNHFRDDVQD